MSTLSKRIDLEEAIARLVTLGQKDPLTIVRKLEREHGRTWLIAEVTARADDVAAELARQLIGRSRRAGEQALVPGKPLASAEMKLVGVCIPGPDGFSVWKRLADCSRDDLEARARMYDRLAAGSLRRASWFRSVADLMAAEGIEKLGKLRAELPPLPDDEVLALAS